MGSFIGHILPGTFFFIFSLWWTWCVLHRYFVCLRENGERGIKPSRRARGPVTYKSVLSYSCPCSSSKIPCEGIVKVAAVVIGMTGEFLSGFENGHFTHFNNAQHMTMYFFFGLNGVVDILQHYKMPLPPDLEYVSAILALGMEALLFYYHLHGRPPMDIQVHMLLFYTILCSAAVCALEMSYRKNVLPALGRIHFTMLQGTWFYQTGFILYPPTGEHWDVNDHRQMMIVTLLFTWHNAAIFVFLLVSGILIYFRVKSMDRSTIYQRLDNLPSVPDLNEYTSKMDAEQTKNIFLETDDEEV